MQGHVHRFRLGNWSPSAIRAIAVSKPNAEGIDNHAPQFAAIGREDGEIEISLPSENYCTVGRIPGAEGFRLQALCWSIYHDMDALDGRHAGHYQRLFGISLRGFIFEVDLMNLKLSNINDTFGGAAWSLAACPRSNNLAVGSEDGALRLFEYTGSRLHYVRSFGTSGSRVLSVAYHPTDPRILAGYSDGSIRCLDEATGRVLWKADQGSCSVWSICALADCCVAGDSRGQLHFHDNMGVHIKGFDPHSADILTITSNGRDTVFASGVDGKVVALIRSTHGDSGSSEWVYSHSHRGHSHDVFHLALCGDVLLSGGLDGKIVVYAGDRHRFSSERPTWLPVCGTSSPPCALAQDKSLLVLGSRNSLEIWRCRDARNDQATAPSTAAGASSTAVAAGAATGARVLPSQCQRVEEGDAVFACTVVFRGADHVQQLALLSLGGELVLLSLSAAAIKAFSLNARGPGVTYSKLGMLPLADHGALIATHGASGLCVYDRATRTLTSYSLSLGDGRLSFNPQCSLEHRGASHDSNDDFLAHKLDRAVQRLCVSTNGQLCALGCSQSITVYNLSTRKVIWTIHTPDSHVLQDMVFIDSKQLFVLCSRNKLCGYDCERLEVCEYIAHHGAAVDKFLDPKQFRFPLTSLACSPPVEKRRGQKAGAASSESALVLYGPLYCIHAHLSAPPPSSAFVLRHPVSSIYSGKRKAHGEEDSRGWAIIEWYRNIIHMDMLAPDQLAVVENPWSRINAQLPDTMARKRYMT